MTPQDEAAAAAQRRIALVIGNSAYENGPLRNPVNDARAMAATLRELGFQVTALEDAGRREMHVAIRNFGKSLRQGGVGLFYFAGHGMEVGGTNYLIPVDAQVETEEEVEFESVDANRVLATMDAAGNGMNIVILDACRNNPFARSFRSNTRGLAQMDAPSGSYISYATAPGSVAADGEGANGLYTEQLIEHMRSPGLKIEEMFKLVRVGVSQRSGGKQIPWTSSSLTGDFYFAPEEEEPAPAVAAVAPPPPGQGPVRTIDEEEALWRAIEGSTFLDDFQDYLAAFPQGRFAVTARVRIRQMERQRAREAEQRVAVAEPEPPPPPVPPAAPEESSRAVAPEPEPEPEVEEPPVLRGHEDAVLSVAFSPDGTRALSGSEDETVRLWNLASLTESRKLTGHTRAVMAVAFSPDGGLAVSGSEDNTLRLWDLETGEVIWSARHARDVTAVAFSPGGGFVLSGSQDRLLKLWDSGTGEELQTFKGHTDFVTALAVAADGTRVLSGSLDNTVRLWELQSGQELMRLLGHERDVHAVAFSPDGRLAVSGSLDDTVRVWDLASGEAVHVLKGHTDTVTGVAFARDGRYVLSSSLDNTVRLWDTVAGTEVQVFRGHSRDALSVAVSRDGATALSGSLDRTIRLWELPE